MWDVVRVLLGVLGGLLVGFVVGMLVMRNNYKHFRSDENTFRNIILNPVLKPEQKILHIRNRLNI